MKGVTPSSDPLALRELYITLELFSGLSTRLLNYYYTRCTE